MRIAHVTDCFMPRMGGIERQVHDLALRQRAAGHDVEIITSVSGDTEFPVPVHRPTSTRGKPSTIHYAHSISGARTVLNGKYDVVHMHASTWSPLGYISTLAAIRAGTPVVVTVHSLWASAQPIFTTANRILRYNRLPIVWSAVSSVAAEPLARHLRIGRRAGDARVDVLPNAVEHDVWHIDPLPRDPQRVVIASVMRLALRKRPHQYLEMLRSARALVPSDIRLEAVIIGDGPRREGLEKYLAKHDMTDWVTLYGRATHEQIREVYRDADFFVAPATLESFGIAALEARSAGLPIIAHAKSGVRDFVTHGREGFLASGDTDMTERIAQLVQSPALRAEMSTYNRENTPQFGWDQVLERCYELYERAGYRPDSVDAAELAQKSA